MEKIKLKSNTKIKRNKDVIFKEVDGVVYILDSQESIVRTLNETASFIWRSLKKPRSTKELAQLLSEKFKVEEKKVNTDLKKFISRYLKEKLIVFFNK